MNTNFQTERLNRKKNAGRLCSRIMCRNSRVPNRENKCEDWPKTKWDVQFIFGSGLESVLKAAWKEPVSGEQATVRSNLGTQTGKKIINFNKRHADWSETSGIMTNPLPNKLKLINSALGCSLGGPIMFTIGHSDLTEKCQISNVAFW